MILKNFSSQNVHIINLYDLRVIDIFRKNNRLINVQKIKNHKNKMKLSTIYKLSGTSLLALSLAIIPFTTSTQAQINSEPGVGVVETDSGFDWSLLGLLGLLGLAGLAGRNN